MSTQAIRNYEDAGAIPAAERTDSGYRTYTQRHAAALRAFLALIAGHGHRDALRVMTAVGAADLPAALAVLDAGHAQLSRDRETLASVRTAIALLVGDAPILDTAEAAAERDAPLVSIGALAARLQITPATLRTWEREGILRPERSAHTGQRHYRPDDVRDAELTHLLRRGHQPLARIAGVIEQIRTAGGPAELATTLDGWEQRLTDRGRALLRAAAQLSRYLDDFG